MSKIITNKDGNTKLISLFSHWGEPNLRGWAGAMARASETIEVKFKRKTEDLDDKLKQLSKILQEPDVDTQFKNKNEQTAKMLIQTREKYDLALMSQNKWDNNYQKKIKTKYQQILKTKYQQILKMLYSYRCKRETQARLTINRYFAKMKIGSGVAQRVGDKVTKGIDSLLRDSVLKF